MRNSGLLKPLPQMKIRSPNGESYSQFREYRVISGLFAAIEFYRASHFSDHGIAQGCIPLLKYGTAVSK
jgi:hypothetical protein